MHHNPRRMERALESLAVVMPAYNESIVIEKVLPGWLDVVRKVEGDAKLLVIDDGSIDETGAILDRYKKREPLLLVHHQENTGHGRAILKGYTLALNQGFQWVFQVDSDGQFDPADFWKLWEKRTTASFVLAVRQREKDPIHRRWA